MTLVLLFALQVLLKRVNMKATQGIYALTMLTMPLLAIYMVLMTNESNLDKFSMHATTNMSTFGLEFMVFSFIFSVDFRLTLFVGVPCYLCSIFTLAEIIEE